MTYNPSIPQPTDLISTSQGQILTNFTQLNTQFAGDHVAFNTGSSNGNGHHKKVSFDASITPAAPTGTQSVLYPKTVGSAIQLFFQTASETIQITGGSAVPAQTGSVWLPGKILLNWGVGVATTGGTVNSFVTGFPTACWGVTMSIQSNTVSSLHSVWCSTDPPSTTQFTAKSDSSSLKIFWYAIGN